jgi:ribose 5-phosphate isomerase B
MRIVLTADHAGVDLKDELAAWLGEQGHDILDLGTHGHESVDYPRYGAMLAEAIADGRAERGITVCGSGIGVAIAANRNPACRCAQVGEPLSAALARRHNDANAIALGARLIGIEMAKACAAAFIDTQFEGGRHQRRVDQLSQLLQESD